MTRRRLRILIVGAGIAGLSAAIALRQTGHDVTVLERTPRLQPLGAGLILWSNATAALAAIGLEASAREISNTLSAGLIRSPDGTVLSKGDMVALAQETGHPTLAVHRADLLKMLFGQVPEGTVHFDHELTGFRSAAGGAVARFSDGTEHEGDILVGADGIWSAVRTSIHGSDPPRYSGYLAWRGVVSGVGAAEARSVSSETWGCGYRFGWVPLNNNRIYWFAVKNAPEDQQPRSDGSKAELLELFEDWHDPIAETVAACDDVNILRHNIYDRPPVRPWGRGPVTLIGDAAHPMTPNTGQGAATSIEDAVTLAACLQRFSTVEGALRGYEQRRYARTAMLVELSRRIGAATQVENQSLCRLRNRIIRLTPERVTLNQFRRIVDWRPPNIEQDPG
jgi:FAD-dependent urate hydroxylase